MIKISKITEAYCNKHKDSIKLYTNMDFLSSRKILKHKFVKTKYLLY